MRRLFLLERQTPDGAKFYAFLTPGARDILSASSSHPVDLPLPDPPTFEATGLRCYSCYDIHRDLPEVLWMLADRRRLRAMRTAYRRKRK